MAATVVAEIGSLGRFDSARRMPFLPEPCSIMKLRVGTTGQYYPGLRALRAPLQLAAKHPPPTSLFRLPW
ncbi:hypothetical protein [Siccirubricoccus sp. G192]|uniref:hypothetical protein n=1 Tax=Siccirubricoccus sp. G192 TaxID=2849651 RepID=UPI001C2CA352|nr:hypothetical protein [Siccirubricoccus sp. G192]MBV1797516.1 hypothetical protein [Siccirubricoccus sp. G192]